MKRPLAVSALAFAAGIYLAGQGWAGLPAGLSLFAVALLLLAAAYGDRRLQFPGVLVLFLAAGSICYLLHTAGPPGDPLYRAHFDAPEALYTLEATVRDAPIMRPETDYARLILDVDTVTVRGARHPLRGGVVIRWTHPTFPILPGERVRVRGFLESRLGPVNFGLAGMEGYFRLHRVHTQMRVRGDHLERIGADRWSPHYWAGRLRAWEAEILAAAVPAGALGFVYAVWLGDRAGMDHSRYQEYIDTGTAHILAVSGVHCGLIFMTVVFLLRSSIRRPKVWGLIAVAAVFVFALAAGARISSLRAAFMLAVFLAAELLDREPDAPTALGISALVFLFFKPVWLFETGFLLSFASVASILLFVPLVRTEARALPRALQAGVSTTLGVQIVPLPIAANAFHVIPLLSPFANLIVVPLLTAVLWLCLLTVIAGALFPPVAPLFGHALVPVVGGIETLVGFLAESRVGRVIAPSPAWPALIAYAVAAGLLWHALTRREGRRAGFALAGAAFALTMLLWNVHPAPAGVDFLDVGHGDAALLRTPGGTTVLIDGGDASAYTDLGARVVVPFLLAHGVTRLDYVVVTHPDRDHIGGIFEVLDNLRVGRVVIGPRDHDNPLERALLAACEVRGVPVLRLARGDTLPVDGATVSVLHPPAAAAVNSDVNDDSLVLHASWPGVSVLFSGDVERTAEQELLSVPCGAAILKAPHHGSNTSSSAAFLDHVAPRMVVISTGTKAGRVPVSPEVLKRYEARGIRSLRTDRRGGIRLRHHDGALVLQSAREARGYLLDQRPE